MSNEPRNLNTDRDYAGALVLMGAHVERIGDQLFVHVESSRIDNCVIHVYATPLPVGVVGRGIHRMIEVIAPGEQPRTDAPLVLVLKRDEGAPDEDTRRTEPSPHSTDEWLPWAPPSRGRIVPAGPERITEAMADPKVVHGFKAGSVDDAALLGTETP